MTKRSRNATMAGMAGRPKQFDPEAALDAAVELFWSKGFEACSMAELLAEMQINRQSLYDTYGDKRELFMAVLAKYMDRVGDEMRTALGTGRTPFARLQNFFKLLGKRLTARSVTGCLLTNTVVELGPHDAQVRKTVTSQWRRLEDALAELFQEAIDQREIRPTENPRQLARLMMTVMQGGVVLSKAGMKDCVKDALKCAEKMLEGLK